MTPQHSVKVHRDSNDRSYSRLFDSPDFDLDIAVENGPIRWEAPFWFYVLPIPVHCDYLATKPVGVRIHLKPQSPEIAFDPWQVFFLGTNHVAVSPAGIWQDGKWLGTNILAAFPITNSTTFFLEFSPWKQVNSDRDLPFQISVEGISVSGRNARLPPVTFRPTAFVRAGFKLP
jgi:hypothetical protein